MVKYRKGVVCTAFHIGENRCTCGSFINLERREGLLCGIASGDNNRSLLISGYRHNASSCRRKVNGMTRTAKRNLFRRNKTHLGPLRLAKLF